MSTELKHEHILAVLDEYTDILYSVGDKKGHLSVDKAMRETREPASDLAAMRNQRDALVKAAEDVVRWGIGGLCSVEEMDALRQALKAAKDGDE